MTAPLVMSDRELAEWDWVVLPNGEKLHHCEDFKQDIEADQMTACGFRGWLSIPGLFTRMGAERCQRCCDKLGYPRGVGSPKNDDACASLVQERLRVTTPDVSDAT